MRPHKQIAHKFHSNQEVQITKLEKPEGFEVYLKSMPFFVWEFLRLHSRQTTKSQQSLWNFQQNLNNAQRRNRNM